MKCLYFSTFYNDVFHTQPIYVIHVQEVCDIVQDKIITVFLFLFQKDFDIFQELLFLAFLRFVDNV